jgi:hypothetical protein
MIDTILTGVKIWLGVFSFLITLVFLLHLLNKMDD